MSGVTSEQVACVTLKCQDGEQFGARLLQNDTRGLEITTNNAWRIVQIGYGEGSSYKLEQFAGL